MFNKDKNNETVNKPSDETVELVKQIKDINPDANVEGLGVDDLEQVLKALKAKADKDAGKREKGKAYVKQGKSVTVRGKVLGEGKELPDDLPKDTIKRLQDKNLVEVEK